jgi:hypothetical protein
MPRLRRKAILPMLPMPDAALSPLFMPAGNGRPCECGGGSSCACGAAVPPDVVTPATLQGAMNGMLSSVVPFGDQSVTVAEDTYALTRSEDVSRKTLCDLKAAAMNAHTQADQASVAQAVLVVGAALALRSLGEEDLEQLRACSDDRSLAILHGVATMTASDLKSYALGLAHDASQGCCDARAEIEAVGRAAQCGDPDATNIAILLGQVGQQPTGVPVPAQPTGPLPGVPALNQPSGGGPVPVPQSGPSTGIYLNRPSAPATPTTVTPGLYRSTPPQQGPLHLDFSYNQLPIPR